MRTTDDDQGGPGGSDPKLTKDAHSFTWIPLKQLTVKWKNAQRPTNETRAKNIADNFNPDVFGAIIVTLPDKRGMHHIIDGAHRCMAVGMRYGENEKVPCIVLDVEDPVHAARLFDAGNTTARPPSPLEKFLVRVTAKVKINTDVNNIVERCGYHVGSGANGTIRAVTSLINVHKMGESHNLLQDTLMTIRAIWRDDVNAVAGDIILGFGLFLNHYAVELNQDRLIERMEKKWTPGQLGAEGSMLKNSHGGKGKAIKFIIRETYNTGLRTGHRLGEDKPEE